MNIKRNFLVLLLAFVCCIVSNAQDVKKIAILETVDKEDNVKYGVELTVRAQMTKAITEIDGYEAFDRVSLSQLMGEHNFQRTGYVSDEQIKALGEATGASYVLILEVAYVDEVTIILTSQIIDIESTKVMQVAIEQSATDGASILKACRALTRQLLLADSSPSKSNAGNSSYVQQSTTMPNQQSHQNSVREIEVNGVKFKMIYVAGGTFMMGATAEQTGYNNDETPVHQVTLSDYFIGETEVTQELWYAVMGNNPSNFTRSSRNPVENVSWFDSQAFVQKLNQLTGLRFRLPTEAEWEYAARGGNKSKGYKYSGSNRIDDVAWYNGNSGNVTHEVAKCYPNELGIYDMSGNVWEWCNDWYSSNYSSAAQCDPEGPTSGSYRVLRGGGWNSNATRCRVSRRNGGTPDYRDNGRGFRLVCSRL